MQGAPKPVPAAAGEAELVRRALARDEAAVRAIIKANNRRLYRLARGILRNDGEAEDVVQETYVRAFTRLADFRGESSLSTWLSRIAMNEALGRLRRERPGVDIVVDERAENRPVPFDRQADQRRGTRGAELAARRRQRVIARHSDSSVRTST